MTEKQELPKEFNVRIITVVTYPTVRRSIGEIIECGPDRALSAKQGKQLIDYKCANVVGSTADKKWLENNPQNAPVQDPVEEFEGDFDNEDIVGDPDDSNDTGDGLSDDDGDDDNDVPDDEPKDDVIGA